MSADSFASLICSKIKAAVGVDGGKYDGSTASACQNAIASAVSQYLKANVRVHVVYNGMTTTSPSKPDVVSDEKFEILGECSPTSVPHDFNSWVKEIQSNISSGFTIKSPGVNSVVTSFNPFNPAVGSLSIAQGNLKSAHEGSIKDPLQKTWTVVCKAIMDWVNSASSCNPAAKEVVATRPGSAGTVSIIKIEVT